MITIHAVKNHTSPVPRIVNVASVLNSRIVIPETAITIHNGPYLDILRLDRADTLKLIQALFRSLRGQTTRL